MIAEIVVAVAIIFSLVTAIWPVMVGQNVKCMYTAITVNSLLQLLWPTLVAWHGQ